MNKRIKEIAEQAGNHYRMFPGADMFPTPVYGTVPVEFLDKFAELIVKECVNVVEGGSFLHDQAPTAIFAKECSAAIKRHFRVKE
jgi:hypothetical protein